MIEELNLFFKALQERYGKTGFVTEVTITNEAAGFIPHISPKPGEAIELCFSIGRILVRNGGDPAPEIHEAGHTKAGHPYAVQEVKDNGFKKGIVGLPSGQSVDVVWDHEGNVFHIEGWGNHREMFCIAKEGAIACDVIPLHAPEPEPEPQPTRLIPHSLREVLNLPDPDEQEEEAPAQMGTAMTPEIMADIEARRVKEEGETVAGYHFTICGQNTDTGYRFGHVTLPNGETHAAEWDLAGNDTGGRRKFKIEAKDGN